MRKILQLLPILVGLLSVSSAQAQWQRAILRTNCLAPVFNTYAAIPAADFTTQGYVHIANFPADCGAAVGAGQSTYRWTNYILPLNICVNNNFQFDFRVRNSTIGSMGGDVNNDISVEVSGPGNWVCGATVIDNTGGTLASQYAYGWAGIWAAQANPPAPANNPFVVPPDSLFHTIRLSYNNGFLTVSRDGMQLGAPIAANSTPNICSITQLRIQFKGNGWIDWVQGQTGTGLNWLESFNNSTNYALPSVPAGNCPQPPALSPSVLATPTCASNQLVLNSGLTGTGTVSWMSPGGTAYSGNQITVPGTTAGIAGTWTLTASGGCSSANASLNVAFTAPSLGAPVRRDTTICQGDTIRLQASGGGTYSWTPSTGSISGANTANPLVWPAGSSTYLVAISNGSCSRTDTFRVNTTNCHCEDSCNWSLTGNSNVKARNFIGSLNAADFKIRTANIQRMVVSATGKVGIGTAAPGAALEVNSQVPGSYGLRFTQQMTPAASNGTALSVDAGGNVILVSQPAGGNSGWNLDGNDVSADCDGPFIGTNTAADFRFRTNSQHRMRLTATGSLSIEPTCGSNNASEPANLMTGVFNDLGGGSVYNAVNGEGNKVYQGSNNLVGGSGNSVNGGKRFYTNNNLVSGSGNTLNTVENGAVIGAGLQSTGAGTLHFGAGRLSNNVPNSMMVGWGDQHTLIADATGLAIYTATSGAPAAGTADMPSARLDVNAAPFFLTPMNVYPVSGVRLRNLGQNRGRALVVDDQGYVYVDGDPGGGGGGPTDGGGGGVETGRKLEQLQQEVEALKQQVQLLMKALQTPVAPAGAHTLEVVPTPFDKAARAVYSLEGFSGNAVLQVSDASGRVLKSFPVRSAKGAIELGNLWATDGVLLFSIVDGGKVLISVRSIKQSH